MANLRTILIGLLVIGILVIISLIVLYLNSNDCPFGSMACGSGNICVPQKYVCNKRFDCPGGEDEDYILCNDLHGSNNMIEQHFSNDSVSASEFEKTSNSCNISQYPDSCSCKYYLRIYCKQVGFKSVPQTIDPSITHLVLANNSITTLTRYSFSRYNLKLIHLEGNQIEYLPPLIFAEQKQLERLFITNNKLRKIEKNVFSGLHSLLWLFLENNFIEEIYINDFQDLNSCIWINLSNNKLSLNGDKFPKISELMELFINNNKIRSIGKSLFEELTSLELLSLRYNIIAYIDPDSFSTLKNLKELDLYGNHIRQLSSYVFLSQTSITKLSLGSNPFTYIPSELFINMRELASLNLEDIQIDNIDIQMFSKLGKLESIYFKKYSYCSYAPNIKRCRPVSDGISSMHQLLYKPIYRYATWGICLGTCVGNLLVLWGRHFFRDENKNLSLVVRNLAVSDLLMGIYLLMIAVHDIKFRNVYNHEAHSWINSWACTITGILGMVSSEVSVLLLLFMSIDRFLIIAIPFGKYNTLTMRETIMVLIAIWILGIAVAILPVFKFISSTKFYGISGLCFPLHITDPYFIGWEISAFIFFGINATSLIIIAVVYIGMFVSILKTRAATSLPMKDYEFAVRFFFIVLTDALCWVPIICVKAYAFSGAEISVDLYAWLIIFILPINSALNPLLYTFTTPKYRANFYLGSGNKQNTPRQIKCGSGETGSVTMARRKSSSRINRNTF